MLGIVVNNFVDNHQLNLSSGWHEMGSNLGLNEFTDIRIVTVLLLGLVVNDVGMSLGMGGSSCFDSLLVDLQFRRSTLEPRGGS